MSVYSIENFLCSEMRMQHYSYLPVRQWEVKLLYCYHNHLLHHYQHQVSIAKQKSATVIVH